MFAALIPLLVTLLVAAIVRTRSRLKLTIRESMLIAAVLSGTWLVVGIEVLSLVHALTYWPMLLWWLLPIPGLLAALVCTRARRRLFPAWPTLTAIDYSLLAIIVAVLGWSWCQAWFSPPNNVDSQEYHLQRQVYWAQQASVEHFATSNLRQVAMPPLTEFAGLTLMVLTDGDRLHNQVQWLAFVLALCAVSLTTRRLTRSATAQLFAALWTVTIPLAFLQSSTTKNDVVVLTLACLLAYWTLLLNSRSRIRWGMIGLMGLALGEIVLTKGTGMIFAVPILGWAALLLLRWHPRAAIPALAAIAALALAINAGHFARNYRTFHSVAPDEPGIHDGPSLANEDHSLAGLTSNMLRSLGSHCTTPSKTWNDRLTAGMRRLHEMIGRDIDDRKTTWFPLGRFRPYQFWQNDEDKAGAPAHLLIFLLLPAALWFRRRDAPWLELVAILTMAIGGFVLFSWALKWQNWHVRLIITLPALVAPVFGWSCRGHGWRWAGGASALLLVVTLTPSLNSLQHPMWGLKSIFTADPLALRCYYRPTWPAEYREMAQQIAERKAVTVGFFTGAGSPDYPMQRLLLDTLHPRPTFTAFNGKLQAPGRLESDPDVLLVARTNATRLRHESTGTWYVLDKRIGRYGLFRRE